MGCSRVGIGGGVVGLDDNLGVSSNIGLGYVQNLERIERKGLMYLLPLIDAFSTHFLMHARQLS
jgi:hypothetical protein